MLHTDFSPLCEGEADGWVQHIYYLFFHLNTSFRYLCLCSDCQPKSVVGMCRLYPDWYQEIWTEKTPKKYLLIRSKSHWEGFKCDLNHIYTDVSGCSSGSYQSVSCVTCGSPRNDDIRIRVTEVPQGGWAGSWQSTVNGQSSCSVTWQRDCLGNQDGAYVVTTATHVDSLVISGHSLDFLWTWKFGLNSLLQQTEHNLSFFPPVTRLCLLSFYIVRVFRSVTVVMSLPSCVNLPTYFMALRVHHSLFSCTAISSIS